MARRFAFALLGLLFLTALGCEDAGVTADDTLPAPNFNPPQLAQTASPAPRYTAPVVTPTPSPRPVQVAQRQVAPPAAMRASPFGPIPADWIPHVQARPWQWIVIHHTATTFGNAAIVTRWHIDRGFDEMGYHFLIGNGTNSGDGQIEVGTRWPKQKWGAHTKTPDNRFNDYGIGICLVGNFDVQYPSAAQTHSLEKLVAYLMETYHIPPDHVLGHRDCKSTECPGKNLNVAVIRNAAVAMIKRGGLPVPQETRLAQGELIHSVP